MNYRPNSESIWAHSIAGVAFDMDGLLVNTEELYTEVGQTLLQRRGRVFTHQLKNAMTGLPGDRAFQIMIEAEQLSDSVEQLEEESAEIFSGILPSKLALLAGVPELLDWLAQAGIPRCVATSSSHVFAKTVLNSVDIRAHFDFVITAEDVRQGKPSPDIYLAAAERLGVHAHQLLVLEDSHHGCRAGISAGACTIAVPGDHSRDHDFAGVFAIADTLRDPIIRRVLSS